MTSKVSNLNFINIFVHKQRKAEMSGLPDAENQRVSREVENRAKNRLKLTQVNFFIF